MFLTRALLLLLTLRPKSNYKLSPLPNIYFYR